jgi:hypothetical protein
MQTEVLTSSRKVEQYKPLLVGVSGSDCIAISEFNANMTVGRCRLKRVDSRVETAWVPCLKLTYECQLSIFAVKLNLGHYLSVLRKVVRLFEWLGGAAQVDPRLTPG